MSPTQAYPSLLPVIFAVVLPREHRAIEDIHAAGQVDPVLVQVRSPFARIVAHATIIVYAFIIFGKPPGGASKHAIADLFAAGKRFCELAIAPFAARLHIRTARADKGDGQHAGGIARMRRPRRCTGHSTAWRHKSPATQEPGDTRARRFSQRGNIPDTSPGTCPPILHQCSQLSPRCYLNSGVARGADSLARLRGRLWWGQRLPEAPSSRPSPRERGEESAYLHSGAFQTCNGDERALFAYVERIASSTGTCGR